MFSNRIKLLFIKNLALFILKQSFFLGITKKAERIPSRPRAHPDMSTLYSSLRPPERDPERTRP